MSYATYNARTVRKACENWIAALNEDIDRQKQELIRKAMLPNWRGRVRTREEAIKWLSTSDPLEFSEFALVEMMGWRDKDRVEALLVLATTAPSDINICSADAYLLKGFL